MSKTVTRVCVTLNNYNNKNYEDFKAWGINNCKYIVIGKEVGDSGTPHLQAFFILNKKKRINSVTSTLTTLFGKAPHTEAANGPNDAAADYCKKDGIFFENGTYPKSRGERTDIKKFLNAVKQGADNSVLAEEYPTEFAKYHAAADKLRRTEKRNKGIKRNRENFESKPLRNWQQDALDKLMTQDDRKVTWVHDPRGALGKSWFANWLVANHGAFLIEGGKTSDIAYAYDLEHIVIFDFTRCQEERVNYAVIESFKNGRIFSSKYESTLKIFDPARVLCLSNFMPDRSMLSEDRWQLLSYDGPHRAGWMQIPPLVGCPNSDEPSDAPPKKKRKLNNGKPALERNDCVLDERRQPKIKEAFRQAPCCDECGQCNCQPIYGCH